MLGEGGLQWLCVLSQIQLIISKQCISKDFWGYGEKKKCSMTWLHPNQLSRYRTSPVDSNEAYSCHAEIADVSLFALLTHNLQVALCSLLHVILLCSTVCCASLNTGQGRCCIFAQMGNMVSFVMCCMLLLYFCHCGHALPWVLPCLCLPCTKTNTLSLQSAALWVSHKKNKRWWQQKPWTLLSDPEAASTAVMSHRNNSGAQSVHCLPDGLTYPPVISLSLETTWTHRSHNVKIFPVFRRTRWWYWACWPHSGCIGVSYEGHLLILQVVHQDLIITPLYPQMAGPLKQPEVWQILEPPLWRDVGFGPQHTMSWV